MYDPATINANVNLLDLVGGDSTLCKVTAGEQAGPCPKCGGKDRLHVTATWWFCRQCHPKRGDAIEYVQWRDDVGFVEACELLGGDKSALEGPRMAGTNETRPKTPILRDSEAPGDKWQQSARAFVDMAAGILWQTPAALAYLVGRGLSEATIKAAHLGYWPRTDYRPGERWGQDKDVWLPRGWVIPCEYMGQLQYVKIRRPAEDTGPDGKNKYIAVKGSKKRGAVYNLADLAGKADGVLTEGEINALILKQALGDACGVASVGDAGNMPGAQALPVLARVKRLWLAYDPDKAGQDGAAKMAGLSARARVLPWPWADRGEKYDIADAYKDGENLAAWVFANIGPSTPVARSRWFEHLVRPYLADPTIERGDPKYKIGRALLNAWEMLQLDSEALAELAQDDYEPAYQCPRPGAAIWQDPDGGETAVQVLAPSGRPGQKGRLMDIRRD
jgi:DNA primase